jgi:DNA-binding CsgD family transcriptional regulator
MSVRKVSSEFGNLLKTNSRTDQYFKYESEEDYSKIIQSLSLVERLYPDQVLMLCNRSHPKLQYVGANCLNVFGYSVTEFQKLTVHDFFSSVHTDDLRDLLQCFEFINGTEPYDPIDHRFVLSYRFKNKNGNYFHLRDEKLAIQTDSGKYIYFSMFSVTSQDKFYRVKLDIHQRSKGSGFKVSTYHPRQTDHSITPRQNEIVKFMMRGFSTQEIAEQLNVSVNTIKNHKQVLFRKVNVKSSLELIDFANRNWSVM